MSNVQRRDVLIRLSACCGSCGRGKASAGRRPELHEQRPRPAARRRGTADLQVRPGEVRGEGHRRAAPARRRPSSSCRSPRGSPASRCGSSRARCASCTGTPPRPSGRSSSRGGSGPRSSTRRASAETNDFEPGDVWYFPRGHGHMLAVPGRRALPLHPDLRQRLLLRVRHLQHHRLDRPRPEGRSWRRTSASPSRPSTGSRRRRSTSPAGAVPPEQAGRPAPGA